jgi:hypothetical protein
LSPYRDKKVVGIAFFIALTSSAGIPGDKKQVIIIKAEYCLPIN